MAKLIHDEVGKRFYETGVSKGVLFPMASNGTYEKGVAWNGLSAVNENPTGAEETPVYADNIKYLSLYSKEDFGATIECYYYPEEFEPCNGTVEIGTGVTITQQARKKFGFAYITNIGNDTAGQNYGQKLHLIYGATASPSSKNNSTINENPEAGTLSYEIKTIPTAVEGKEPTAHLIIDSTKLTSTVWNKVLDIIYATDGDPTAEPPVAETDPTLPTPDRLIELVPELAPTTNG